MRFGRILLTGGTGQVGWELIRTLSPLGEVLTPGRDEFNLANPESLREKIDEWRPDKVCHLASMAGVRYSIQHPKLYVDVNINGTNIKIKGSLGELDLDFNSNMLISYDDNKISVKRPSDEKKYKEFHGLRIQKLVYFLYLL